MSESRTNKQRSQATCDAWNQANPVRSLVTVELDSGERRLTQTRTEAYVSDSGYPVIFLDGVRGYYLLDRVRSAS